MNKKKKVLFLVNIPSPYRVEFFEELGKLCELTVLYEKGEAEDREWEYAEKTSYSSVFLKGIKTGLDNALCFGVLKYLNKKYDVIVVGGYSTPTGMLAIKYLNINKIPFYLNCDGGIVKEEKKLNYIIKKHFIGSATYWLSSGKETNKYLVHYGAIESRIFNYPFTSVRQADILEKNLSKEERQALKEELGIKEEKIVISVGQFIRRKGFDTLIRASDKLKENVGVYIIGGTPTKEYMELLNECQNKNIHFVAFCNPSTLRRYYRIADCMAFPTREDIWGLVINEALSNRLPIVSSDKCVAASEILGDAGYIVPSDDVEALHVAINKVIEDEQAQREMAEKAYKRIQEYTIENMALVHMEIFNHVN